MAFALNPENREGSSDAHTSMFHHGIEKVKEILLQSRPLPSDSGRELRSRFPEVPEAAESLVELVEAPHRCALVRTRCAPAWVRAFLAGAHRTSRTMAQTALQGHEPAEEPNTLTTEQVKQSFIWPPDEFGKVECLFCKLKISGDSSRSNVRKKHLERLHMDKFGMYDVG